MFPVKRWNFHIMTWRLYRRLTFDALQLITEERCQIIRLSQIQSSDGSMLISPIVSMNSESPSKPSLESSEMNSCSGDSVSACTRDIICRKYHVKTLNNQTIRLLHHREPCSNAESISKIIDLISNATWFLEQQPWFHLVFYHYHSAELTPPPTLLPRCHFCPRQNKSLLSKTEL